MQLSLDSYLLVHQVKSRLRRIPRIGLEIWNGLKHANKLLQHPVICPSSRDLTNSSSQIIASSKRSLILLNHITCLYLGNGAPSSILSRSLLSLNQSGPISSCQASKTLWLSTWASLTLNHLHSTLLNLTEIARSQHHLFSSSQQDQTQYLTL